MVGNQVPFDGKNEQELLEFYQNKFEEFLRRDDKYREKIDKYLRELIEDRYELEAEVTRKGEKISALQKALVDLQLSLFEEKERFLILSDENERLKRNEEQLHKNIRQLLSRTKDQDLRDRIIHIIQDPKVEIHYRHVEGKSAGTSSATNQKSTSDLIKEEIQQLQSKIDEYSRLSKNNSDVVLEDCKNALEKSREKILEDEQEIRKLQKKLQESETKIYDLQQTSSHHSNSEQYINQNMQQISSNVPCSSSEDESINNFSKPSSRPILSDIADIKLSLASLSQFLSQVESLLKNLKSSGTFIACTNQPADTAVTEYVAEKHIVDLQDFIRKCTRLSYDIKNVWVSVSKEIAKQDMPVRQRDIQQFYTSIDALIVATAETDLLALGLDRAKFFEYLTTRTVSLFDLDDNDAPNHSKCADNVVALGDKVKSATLLVKTATDIIERMNRNIELVESHQKKSLPGRQPDEKQQSTSELRSTESKRVRFQAETLPKQMSFTDSRRTRSEPIGGGEITRRIDKTLSKIRQIETGEYAKDIALCQHLAEQIRALSDRLKALYEEFNDRSVQGSFTEFSAVTLSKLETLAKQSRDAVMVAEAQIIAYRSNAQALSEKLKNTQELLRESISECLGLKRKLSKMEVSIGAQKPKISDDDLQTFLRSKAYEEANKPDSPEFEQQDAFSQTMDTRQTFLRTRNAQDPNKPQSPDNPKQTFFRTIDLDGNDTSVKRIASSSKSPKKPGGPFECMFCKQGSDHHLCIEKIRDLQATIRRLNVQLKASDKEAKSEKKMAIVFKDAADKANLDLENEKKNAKETITALEAKISSLLDQLKVLKNRLKNIERFRHLEMEGFQTDIRNLKMKIRELERQLTRAVHVFEHDQNNMDFLKKIHETARQSKSSVAALKRLKAKIYEIETDIKRV